MIAVEIRQGDEAPSDIHPYWLQREDGTRVNYSQLTPYLSAEAREHWDALHNLHVIFADLFQHIDKEVGLHDNHSASDVNYFPRSPATYLKNIRG